MRRILLGLAIVVLILVGSGLAMADSFTLRLTGSVNADITVTATLVAGSYYGGDSSKPYLANQYAVTDGSGKVNGNFLTLIPNPFQWPIWLSSVTAGSATPDWIQTGTQVTSSDNLYYPDNNGYLVDSGGPLFTYVDGSSFHHFVAVFLDGIHYDYIDEYLNASQQWRLAEWEHNIGLTVTENTVKTPEPSLILLLGIGIGIISLLAWRIKA